MITKMTTTTATLIHVIRRGVRFVEGGGPVKSESSYPHPSPIPKPPNPKPLM